MKNLINEIKGISKDEIKNFGIIEIFIIHNELHTTSNYEIPNYIYSKIEKETINKIIKTDLICQNWHCECSVI